MSGQGPDIKFYHLQRQSLEQALPLLMERVFENGLRATLKAPDSEQLSTLNKALWTYRDDSFLPHDQAGCKNPEDQVIYLTTGDENPNNANCLVIINAASVAAVEGFERVMYMFDGRDAAVVAKAREDWKRFQDQDQLMSYWQQSEEGRWEKKA